MAIKFPEDYGLYIDHLTPLSSSSSEPRSISPEAEESYTELSKKLDKYAMIYTKIAKQGWSLGDVTLSSTGTFDVEEDATEVVPGSQIRVGDKIIAETDQHGDRVAYWNIEVVKHRGNRGFKDRWGGDFCNREECFVDSRYYRVVLPRPKPEVNEFGLVHP